MVWLELRDTGVSILDVLEAISEGLGIEGILVRFPGLLASDIAESAAVARFVLLRQGRPANRTALARTRHHHFAHQRVKTGRWTKDEEGELAKLMGSGASPDNAARILLRMRADVCVKLRALKNTEHYSGEEEL